MSKYFSIPVIMFGLLVAMAVPVKAQQVLLRGLVTDSLTRKPVVSVKVKAIGSAGFTVTDSNGHFSLPVAHAGVFTVELTHVSYRSVTVRLNTGERSHLILVPKNVGIQEVSVVSDEVVSPIKELTLEPKAWKTSVTKIDAKEIEQIGAITVFDALKYSTNGMPSTQGRRKKYYYLVRGQNIAADYAINGISLSTNGAGPMAEWVEAPSMLPANMIESVEVVRNGNSLLLGFSGLNGVINIKTRKFEKMTTSAELAYGTFNSIRAGVLHGGKIGGLHYAFSLFNDRTDGPKGRHSYENMWNFYSKLNYNFKDRLEIDVENFYDYGTRYVTRAVDYEGLALPQRQLAEIWEYDPLRYNIFTAKAKLKEAKGASTELQFSYILNRMDLYPDAYEYSVDTLTNEPVIGDSIVRSEMLNEPDTIVGLGLFQAVRLFPSNLLRLAAMYAKSANYTHGEAKKTIYCATILDQHRFKQLELYAGVKFIREYYNYYVPNQGFGDENRAVQNEWQPLLTNISSGFSWYLTQQLSLNTILNTGILPLDNTALQLYDDGTTGSLKQERRTGMDIGLEEKSPDYGDWTLTLFTLLQNNTSEYTTQAYYDDDDQIRYYQENINLRTFGVEMSYHSRSIWNHWNVFGNCSYKFIYQSAESVYKKYAKQPPFILNAGVGYWVGNWRFNLMSRYVSKYKTDRFLKEEVTIGNYLNCDLNGNFSFYHSLLELSASVTNLFDKKYCTVSPIYPDFGRQFKIGLKLQLGHL